MTINLDDLNLQSTSSEEGMYVYVVSLHKTQWRSSALRIPPSVKRYAKGEREGSELPRETKGLIIHGISVRERNGSVVSNFSKYSHEF